MAIDTSNLEQLSADELAVLIKKAREVRAKKATPTVKVNGFVTSVGKHVNGALEAVKKLSQSEGVSDKKWEEVESQLKRLSLDSYKAEAEKVKITPRGRKGGRPPKK